MKKKIIFTGGEGRFAKSFYGFNNKYNIKFLNSKELNILSEKSIKKNFIKYKPKVVIHNAGLSRPMISHEKDITESIKKNIIGTCNIVNQCFLKNIKLVYFSTNYVYPGIKGNYSENDPVFPVNNYAWSKLGGESSVKLYKNSLILRLCMCEKPFIHKYAFSDVKTNFMFHEDFIKILPRILNKKGTLNIGGKLQTVYKFAKETKPNVKKISGRKIFPPNPSMNISKLKKFI